jgi:hypothetical protein
MDPLAEYTLNWTPYVYCFNSPVVWIDPDGRYSRLGAWIRNVAWGGNGIKKSSKEWGVRVGGTAPDGNAVIMFVTNGSKPSSGKAGITLHSKEGKDTPGSNDHSILSINWDELKLWFQAIFKDKRQSPHTSEDITIKALEEALPPAESTESANKNNGKTSDKEILEKTGGTAVKKDANGNPLPNGSPFWINNSPDTVSAASADGTINGERFAPGDTIGKIVNGKMKKYPLKK